MNIYDIILELRDDNSSKYKSAVLEKYKTNELFKRVLQYTYSPRMQFYIKQIPDYVPSMNEGVTSDLDVVFRLLDKLANREISGNDAKGIVSATLDSLTDKDAEVFKLILNRSLDCGISDKTINKVWKDLIEEVPYMRCEKLTEKTKKGISYPAVTQLKADGSFINIVLNNDTVTCMTRNGTQIRISKVAEFFQHKMDVVNGNVIMGEIVLMKDGKPLPRKTGNGLINSYAKREATRESILDKQKELVRKGKGATPAFKKLSKDLNDREDEWQKTSDMMHIFGWDSVEYTAWTKGVERTPYNVRFERYKTLIDGCPFMSPIDTFKVESFEEAVTYAKTQMEHGLEGGVLKNVHGIWEDGTSKDQIKIKAVIEADLIITGYSPGEGDFEGGIGALTGETSDGLLISSVSSGMTRYDRGLERVDEEDMSKGLRLRSDIKDIDTFFDETYRSKIMAVKCNDLSKADGNDYWTLSHPVYVEVRNDKNKADTLERLQGEKI